ncbi:MAG: cytochrome c1 [Bdellovibrionales bacterium]
MRENPMQICFHQTIMPAWTGCKRFVRVALCLAIVSGSLAGGVSVSLAENALPSHSPSSGWPHDGVIGTYDRAALRRGLQVYREVCAACHSLKYVAYRNLADLGYSEAEIKSIAAESQVTDGPNDQGEMYTRPALPSDKLVAPFANDQAARVANNGALPPDLSLIIKARQGHEDYVYSLLTGYGLTPSAEEHIMEGMNFNPYFAGHQIAMPSPLSEGAVTYTDGAPATVERMAQDVTQFLAWSGDPKMEERKRVGVKAILFLLVFAGVMAAVKLRVWRGAHK